MKFQELVLLLFLTKFPISSGTFLTDKAAFFANTVFKDFITSVVWQHENPDDVTDFIKKFQGCVVVATVEENESSDEIIREFNIVKTFTQTVFIGADVNEVEYFVALLYRDIVIPIRLIVVLTKPATNSELTELMEVAWNNDVTDILIVSSNNENVTLTTYFPYCNGKCGDFTPVHLDHDTKDLFPKKFLNFHGCEIRTTLLQMSPYSRLKFENNSFVSISGIDGKVMYILFDILNASMKVASAKDHGGIGTIINGTATGSFADLVNKQADVLLPAFLMSKARYSYVQFSHPHESATVVWFGPRRQQISEWLRVLQPFMSHITPALFSTSIVFIMVNIAIRRFVIHRSVSRDSIFFKTFKIFLGIEVRFEPKSFLTNGLLVLWIWFCMVVRIAYQGDLVNGLQKTVLETPLRSFQSAVKLTDGYGGLESIRDFFEGTQYYKQFKVIPISNISDDFKAVEAGKRFLIASDMLMGLDSAPNIQILQDEPVTEVPVCFCMRPGWPAVSNIDNVLLQMIEKGLVEKVFREHSWKWSRPVRRDDRGAKPLTLETLTGCFYGLFVIYGVCTLVLFAEIVYHRMKVNEKKTIFRRNHY